MITLVKTTIEEQPNMAISRAMTASDGMLTVRSYNEKLRTLASVNARHSISAIVVSRMSLYRFKRRVILTNMLKSYY